MDVLDIWSKIWNFAWTSIMDVPIHINWLYEWKKKNWHNATLYIIKKKGLLMDFSGIVRNHGQNEHYSANIQYHVNNVISTYCHINVVATNEYVLSWVFYYNPSVRHYVYDIGLLELFYCGVMLFPEKHFRCSIVADSVIFL